MIGIYKITTPSNRIYIGQSKDLVRRKSDYKYLKCSKLIKNSIKKYGFDNHRFDIIEECEMCDLDAREIYWIEYYKSSKFKYPDSKGLNCTTGGQLVGTKAGYKMSEESKKKISESMKIYRRSVKGKKFPPKSNKYREYLSKRTIEYWAKHAKPIYQYDLNGIFIKAWKSLNEICKETSFSKSKISNCVNLKSKSHKNYIWKYFYVDSLNLIDITDESKYPPTLIPIYQYNMEKELVAKWDNIFSINEKFPTLKVTGVRKCINNHIKSYKNYIWTKEILDSE